MKPLNLSQTLMFLVLSLFVVTGCGLDSNNTEVSAELESVLAKNLADVKVAAMKSCEKTPGLNLNNGPHAPQFPDVVLLTLRLKDGGLYMCSGAKVSAQKVLTAQHCVGTLEDQFLTFDKGVESALLVHEVDCTKGSFTTYQSDKIFRAREGKNNQTLGDEGAKGDLAMVTVKNASWSSFYQIANNVRDLKDQDQVTVVGFGSAVSVDDPNLSASIGTRRTLSFTFNDQIGLELEKGGILIEAPGTDKMISVGDSGGPLLHNGKIVGVASNVIKRQDKWSFFYNNIFTIESSAFIKVSLEQF